MTARFREIRALPDGETRDQLLGARASALRAERLRPQQEPPAPDPRRLLCGCVEPEVGPSVVREDDSCAACSP